MTSSERHKAISVWLDTTSDAGAPAWIVSWDLIDEHGGAEETTTIAVCADRAEAVARGGAEAERRGLPLEVEEARR